MFRVNMKYVLFRWQIWRMRGMPILTKKRCKQQFSIDTNSLEDYLCLFFSFMMTFHVMDNDCHTKLTAQSCNTTMTQNRKCENTKSKSARLLLTTCNSSFVIIEPRECVNSFSYILFLLTINRSKLCFVFCDALLLKRLSCKPLSGSLNLSKQKYTIVRKHMFFFLFFTLRLF